MKQKKRIIFCFLIILSFFCVSIYFSPTKLLSKKIHQIKSTNTSTEIVPVLYVIDGDSFAITLQGKRREVRLIGIDAPELFGKDEKPECFASQSAAFLKTILTDRTVHMTNDPTQDDEDIYGRLLRYVTLSDGTLINEHLIKEGYAREYTYRIPYIYQSQFQKAEETAHIYKKGLWAHDACTTN